MFVLSQAISDSAGAALRVYTPDVSRSSVFRSHITFALLSSECTSTTLRDPALSFFIYKDCYTTSSASCLLPTSFLAPLLHLDPDNILTASTLTSRFYLHNKPLL